MTHSYKVSDDLYTVIFNDGVEVSRIGVWVDKEGAADYGEKVLFDYNDKKRNPDNISYPKKFDEPQTIIIPNAPKEINSPNA